MTWRLPTTELDLDDVEIACRAVAEGRPVSVQLRARGRAIACWFEIHGGELRAWELRAGANPRELDELWRRCGYDGAQRIAVEIVLASSADGERAVMSFDTGRGTNLLARRVGEELVHALGLELGASRVARASS